MCVPGGDASERRGDGGSACNVNIVKEVDGHRVRGNVCLDLVRAMPCGFPLYVTVHARAARARCVACFFTYALWFFRLELLIDLRLVCEVLVSVSCGSRSVRFARVSCLGLRFCILIDLPCLDSIVRGAQCTRCLREEASA